jgi:succinyl-diaminopimelate desuccinylase
VIAESLSGLYCGAIGAGGRDEYYNGEYIHKNCMSPTMIQTADGEIRLCMDMRIAYGTKTEEILSGFKKLVAPKGGKVLDNSLVPATYIDKRRPFMAAFAEAYETACGIKNEFTLAYGGSYAKAMPNIVSWGPIFPWDEDTCHEVNERINIESLVKAAKVYEEAIRLIALSPDSFL